MLSHLAKDAEAWVKAERVLAGLEIDALKQGAVKALAFAAMALVGALAMAHALTLAVILLLAPAVHGAGAAALIAAAGFLVLVLISLLAMRGALRFRPRSIVLRWFTGGRR